MTEATLKSIDEAFGRLEKRIGRRYLRDVADEAFEIRRQVDRANRDFYPAMSRNIIGVNQKPTLLDEFESRPWQPLSKNTLRQKRQVPRYYRGPNRSRLGRSETRPLKDYIRKLNAPSRLRRLNHNGARVTISFGREEFTPEQLDEALKQVDRIQKIKAKRGEITVFPFWPIDADEFGDLDEVFTLHPDKFAVRFTHEFKRPFRRGFFLWWVNRRIPEIINARR